MIPLVPIIFFFIILLSTGHSDDLSLKNSLTFYASFDNGTNAEIAKGDKQLYTLINKKSKLGNHTEGMTKLVKGKAFLVMPYYFLSVMQNGFFMTGIKILTSM